jgi:hypothetical protein
MGQLNVKQSYDSLLKGMQISPLKKPRKASKIKASGVFLYFLLSTGGKIVGVIGGKSGGKTLFPLQHDLDFRHMFNHFFVLPFPNGKHGGGWFSMFCPMPFNYFCHTAMEPFSMAQFLLR